MTAPRRDVITVLAIVAGGLVVSLIVGGLPVALAYRLVTGEEASRWWYVAGGALVAPYFLWLLLRDPQHRR